jgi:Na+/melibiose symporter-like transporter
MILLMSLIPMVLGTVQCILIMKWPLTAGRMQEIRETLEARRGKINMSGGGIED